MGLKFMKHVLCLNQIIDSSSYAILPGKHLLFTKQKAQYTFSFSVLSKKLNIPFSFSVLSISKNMSVSILYLIRSLNFFLFHLFSLQPARLCRSSLRFLFLVVVIRVLVLLRHDQLSSYFAGQAI